MENPHKHNPGLTHAWHAAGLVGQLRSSAGITQGPDGATHQSVLDVALMRNLPNMCVVVPSDSEEARLATIAAAVPCPTRSRAELSSGLVSSE